MKKFKFFLSSLSKFYLCNLGIVAIFVFVLIANFIVQFKVEALQNRIEIGQSEISSYHEKISMLEVEWAYLTRPSRVRNLASEFLSEVRYSVANQIKTKDEMNQFFAENHQKEIINQNKFAALGL